jgi:hypothetical protein
MKTKLCLKNLSVFAFVFFISFPVFSQKAPMKFGSVEKADLEMKVYDLDTSASAVILCDYGFFSSTTYNFTRTIRVKILKPEGTHWGNWMFYIDEDTPIKGVTYNLVNGEIVETKLKTESVYRERVYESRYRTRIAMPNVSPGSVIDIQYTMPWLPNEWRFQQVIPVKRSELVIESSPYVTWRKNYFGFIPLDESTSSRWVTKDVPAFKEEPYVASVTNYLTKFTIEILMISVPPSGSRVGYYKEFSTTWEAVNNQLLEGSHFGMALQGCLFLNDKVKEIKAANLSPMDQVIAAQDFIKQSIKWNEYEAIYISGQSLSEPFKEKIGNSADINLLLVQMLRKLDFKVSPIALSTRDNGFLSPLFPSLDQLNYVVAYVWIDDKPYFVDATEENLPAGILPVRCLNLKGRIIEHGMESDWVDLIPVRKNKKTTQAEFTLTPDLMLAGNIHRNNYDYAALNFRNAYEEFNSEDDFLNHEEEQNTGLMINNFRLSCLDSLYKPVGEEYEVKIKNRVTKIGNQIYLYPLMFEQITENPFKSEERVCPVDFIYPSEFTLLFKYTIPENYKIVELPQSQILKNEDKTLSVQYQLTAIGNTINMTYKFNRSAVHFAIEEYSDIRAFYSELIKKHAEPVILEPL